ncbi:MAG: sugar-binding domain-containing protein, partial [Fimbriimonadales bacterium]
MRFRLLLLVVASVLSSLAPSQQDLARRAHPVASESLQGMLPELAIDGRLDTRWSGIPGHNSGVWYELDWDSPQQVGEVLVRQFQRFTFEWDVQVWDDSAGDWKTIQHFGKPGVRLPGLVLCSIDPPVSTTKVRIANITNGPSFTEVEVYTSAHAHPPTIALASDLRGNFVGMICDGVGSQPIASKSVQIKCETAKGPWYTYAVSDEHGMFTAKMPVAMAGKVTAMADGIEPHHYDSAKFQRSITPLDMNLKPTQLDSGWKFKTDPPKGFQEPGFDDSRWSPIKVPAHWEMEGFKSIDGIGGYRLHFRAPGGGGFSYRHTRSSKFKVQGSKFQLQTRSPKLQTPNSKPRNRQSAIRNPKSAIEGGRLMLRFDGVYSGVDVWVNGKYMAHHEGGFTPFEVDVTDVVKPGDNVLALRVSEHTNVSDNLDKMSLYADFALAGIMRKVTQFRVPSIHVEGYEESCQWGKSEAAITGRIAILNRTMRPAPVSVRVSLESGNRVVAQDSREEIEVDSLSKGEQRFHLEVPNPQQWNAEHPYLYTLRIDLLQGSRTVQTLRQKIGLRQTTIKGPSLLINGTPVKIRGTCHHDQYPTMGRAVTPEIEALDVDLIKKANLNALRTSHYPPMPE